MTVSIPAMLLCLEMALFAVAFHLVYSYRPYRTEEAGATYQGGPLGIRAVAMAFNPARVIADVVRIL